MPLESLHFIAMLRERSVLREWVDRSVKEPDRIEKHSDGTKHFLRQISENEGRWLRVVVNVSENPNKFVTVFFDRRLRREK